MSPDARTSARAHALGAWTLVVLGVAHGAGMLVDVVHPMFFVPTDANVLAAMRVTPVDLGALLGGERMTVWRGHVGWNLSIALGFAFTGALQLLLRRLDPESPAALPLLRVATAASAAWAVLASLFWFWIPCLGFVIATLSLAWALSRRPGLPRRPRGASASSSSDR